MFSGPVKLQVRLPLTHSNGNRSVPIFYGLILLATLALATVQAVHAAPPDAQAKRSPLLAALQAELERSMKTLSALDPPAYYMGYTITETQRADVSGSNGALLTSNEGRNRWLEVSVRTGSYNLDNSHKFGERQAQSGGPGAPVPIDDDAEVLRRTIWLETDKQYRAASEALIAAPINDPTVGPALLTGRAAAVFFHEVFGHRAEGHRQKDVTEGQTFSKKVGEQILPEFLSIADDTTMKKLGKQDLLGYYQFDDEGVPAQRVPLVDHGVLKSFEMSRSPLVGFPHSNGHGRRQLGATPVSRQGNLIVQSSKTVTNAQLRAKLIELIKAQSKPFGLLIDDIAGGFTFTGRGQPQAFQVLPLVVYKVFPDGQPDELVRGVDIVGTPLAALTKIVATGDTPEVFNGYCGAESGSVPVSAASPAILTSELEVQKKESSTDRPPILPPPAHDAIKTGGQQ